MSRTKTATIAESPDVVQLVTAPAKRSVEMTIDPEGMTHILARLTDQYGNPIEATVRELLSNGYDATVLLPEGERRPLEVFLPTALQSLFIVRDHGVGMDEEAIENVYARYGASTKAEDMNQVGAYGLGAKAPLAYCTKFMVTTTKNGWTTQFEVERTAQGNFINIMESQETGEPSGTTVTIPVGRGDYANFQEAVKRYSDHSFDFDILVDGVRPEPEKYIELTDSFLLDEDPNGENAVYGRVWVRPESLDKVLRARVGSTSEDVYFGYLLSGWDYASPALRAVQSWRRPTVDLLVELKPGVVDFSSSRDEVTVNDRSRRLDKRVAVFARDSSKEAMEDFLRVYRTMDRRLAETVFKSALAVGEYSAKGLTFHSDSVDQFLVAPESFTTEEGYAPLAALTARRTPNLIFSFVLDSKAKGVPCLHPAFNRREEQRALVPGVELFEKLTASHSTQAALAATARGRAVGDAATYLLLHYFERRHSKVSWDRIVALPAPTTERETKTLMNLRRVFTENHYDGTLFLLLKSTRGLDAQRELLREYVGMDLTVTTLPDLVKEGRALRKKQRKEREAEAATPAVRVTQLTEGDLSVEKDVVRLARTYGGVLTQVTIPELKKKKALLVLSRSYNNVGSALTGAANAGIAITGRPVYVTNSIHNLKAAHYKELLDYDGVIVTSDFSYAAAAAKTLKERATYRGTTLNSEVKTAPREEFIGAAFHNWYGSAASMLKALLAAEKSNPTHPGSKPILRVMSAHRGYYRSSLGKLSDEQILTGLGKKEGPYLLALRDAIHEVQNNHRDSLVNTLLSALMSHGGAIEGKHAEALLEEFGKLIHSHLPKYATGKN